MCVLLVCHPHSKSSLMLSLFRIVECSSVAAAPSSVAAGGDGALFIDGIDVSLVGLQRLRRSISIIPQDPILFSGTLRDNLDPFGTMQEEQMWSVLAQVGLAGFAATLKNGLDAQVAEYGEVSVR